MIFVLIFLLWGVAAQAQERRVARLDVESYAVDVELMPASHHLAAKTRVRFIPEEETAFATFELNNNLKPSRVLDAAGKTIQAERYSQDGTIRLNFDRPLPKGQPVSLTVEYEGRLESGENQPIEGLKLAYVGDPVSYLLYPGRWFPVAGYEVDRFTAEFNVTVPAGYRVVGPGRSTGAPKMSPGKVTYSYVTDRPSFPGSLAAMRDEAVHVTTGGAPVDVYFRGAEKSQAQTYGEAAGKVLAFFSTKFGPSPVSSLSLVEIDSGSVNGYAAPGIIFLSPAAIGSKLNYRILAHEISHQWWRYLVSPASRSSLWLDEGLATYCEMLYTEEFAGKAAAEDLAKDMAVNALANDSVAVARGDRLEEYSPEYDSLLKKSAMVLHMLRGVIGDDPFFKVLRDFPAKFANRSATSENLEQLFEQASGQKLEGFFIQWVESTGAPEFKADYSIFRTQKGFKIMGKIKQDLDTFRMPVDLRIETDGNPEVKRVDVAGTASDFTVETFGRPRRVIVDPENRVLKYSDSIRVKVAIFRGQQSAEAGEYESALKEYQKALDINKNSSLAHFRIAEVFFNQSNYQSAANAFREALNGDREPPWTEVWSHINLGKIFDITGQRERAVNEYTQAARTKDNTQGAQEEAQKYLQQPYRRERREASQ